MTLIHLECCKTSTDSPQKNINFKSNTDSISQSREFNIKYFKPDTSINNNLFLNSPTSTIKILGDIMPFIDNGADFPDAYFSNKSGMEYLRIVIYPGSFKNSLDLFEVGYSSSLSNIKTKIATEILSFETESHIRLGMKRKELIKIKGDKYTEVDEKNVKIIKYILDDFDNSEFLKRYNMPVYIFQYFFDKDNLIKFSFGFEYP
ncbi:MAG: hypothetical protein U0W24_23115 [Bacteroidales bacterium]